MSKELVAPKAGKITECFKKYGKRVFSQEFELPSAAPGAPPFQFVAFEGMTVPAIILALTPDQHVITVRQFRYGANGFVLEIPGGCPERPGEPPERTIPRELLEETGYEPRQVIELGGPMYFEPASVRTCYRSFLALDCVHVGEPHPDESEIMEVKLYPVRTWVQMIGDGTVNDDKTIAVTLRGLHYLGWRLVG